jgi:hypothetical protein
VECRRYGLGRIRCGTRRQMGAFPVGPHLRDTSRSRSSRKKNSPTSSRPGISRQFGTGHRLTPPLLAVAAHRLSAAGSLASVAVSLRTPAPTPRERPLDCASQRLRHPPRQILSNQPIDPPSSAGNRSSSSSRGAVVRPALPVDTFPIRPHGLLSILANCPLLPREAGNHFPFVLIYRHYIWLTFLLFRNDRVTTDSASVRNFNETFQRNCS